MLKTAKNITSIWAILLLPIILLAVASYWDALISIFLFPIIGNVLTFISLALLVIQQFFLPQIITCFLCVWYIIAIFKVRYTCIKRDYVHCALLITWCIAGTVVSLLALYLIGQGEQGVPLV